MVAHPFCEPGVVKVVAFHKRDGGDRAFLFLRLVGDFNFRTVPALNFNVFANYNVRAEVHRQTYDKADTYLADNFVFSGQTVLVVHLDFLEVIEKSDGTQQDGGDNHQLHVDVRQVAEQEAWNKDGNDDDDTAHRRRPFLAHLSLQAEVAHRLADLQVLQPVDDAPPDGCRDEQRQNQRHPRAERDVFEHPRARQVQLV